MIAVGDKVKIMGTEDSFGEKDFSDYIGRSGEVIPDKEVLGGGITGIWHLVKVEGYDYPMYWHKNDLIKIE